ncbi:MAG: CPBP family intramembrane glutamic endopeptidase [Pararhodobacter sp.]
MRARGPWLVASSLGLIGFMALFVPWVTQRHGFAGYGLAVALYWFAFCLPLGLFFTRGQRKQLVSWRLNGQRWVPWAVAGLALVVLAVTLARPPAGVTALVVVLALGAGVINGPLEELYWRGGYLAQFGASLPGFALGWVLFVAWHLPLALAVGVEYHGGGFALVGGAAGLGLLWAFITWKTRAIGWAMASHALINMIVFHELVATNL